MAVALVVLATWAPAFAGARATPQLAGTSRRTPIVAVEAVDTAQLLARSPVTRLARAARGLL